MAESTSVVRALYYGKHFSHSQINTLVVGSFSITALIELGGSLYTVADHVLAPAASHS